MFLDIGTSDSPGGPAEAHISGPYNTVCPGWSLRVRIPPSPRWCCCWWCPEDTSRTAAHSVTWVLDCGSGWLTWTNTSEGIKCLACPSGFIPWLFFVWTPTPSSAPWSWSCVSPEHRVGSEEIWAKSHYSVFLPHFPQITAAIAAAVIVTVAGRANIFMCQVMWYVCTLTET